MELMEFLTWEFLGTFAGAIIGVGILSQFVKNAGILKRVPTQILSYFLAFIILIFAEFFMAGLTVNFVILTVFNAVVVSLAANGGYSAIRRMTGRKNE